MKRRDTIEQALRDGSRLLWWLERREQRRDERLKHAEARRRAQIAPVARVARLPDGSRFPYLDDTASARPRR